MARSAHLALSGLENLGHHVTRMLADRFGSDREVVVATCVAEAASRLGKVSIKGLGKNERQAWERWAPLVVLLPQIDRWGARDKAALASLISAKGSVSELNYLHKFDRHTRLRRAISTLASAPVKI